MQSKASFDDRCPAKRYELSQCLYVMSARNGLVTLRTIWAVGEQKLRRINGTQRANEETHARLFSFQVEPSWALVLHLFVFPSGCFSSWISSCLETFKLPTILLTFFSWFLMVCKITWVHTIWLCNWCNFMENVLYLPFAYAASRGFSFAWLLAFTKSFTSLFSRVVGLFTPRGVNQPTTRQTRHANDFVNAKSHAKEKPLLAGYHLLYL